MADRPIHRFLAGRTVRPTGGAGVAFPAGNCNLTTAGIFLGAAILFSPSYPNWIDCGLVRHKKFTSPTYINAGNFSPSLGLFQEI